MLVFYIEYIYNVHEPDAETAKEYVILKLLTHAHAKLIEDIRIEGLETYNHEYTIEKFFDDIAKANIYFEIVIAPVVYDFDALPDKGVETKDGIKRHEQPRIEIM